MEIHIDLMDGGQFVPTYKYDEGGWVELEKKNESEAESSETSESEMSEKTDNECCEKNVNKGSEKIIRGAELPDRGNDGCDSHGGRPKKASRIDPDEKEEKSQKMKAKIQMKMKRQQNKSCGKKTLSDAKKDHSPLAKASRSILQIKGANAARQAKEAKAAAKEAKEKEREAKKQKQGLSIDKQVKQGSTSTIDKKKEGLNMAPPAPFVEETDWDDEGFVSQLT
ncbi:galactose oxidase/kelch repeat superfamily protein [Striga asiatica]|uniref:Galactose oxidase/kelch repeat superfamily protein n=1 Tax=Striga asiatica TaxID=4170 RepID=A0A5A7PIA0_STRAF|nr:galactose oxidase/kelch repeat superfamily protein [Striga asiatica]